MSVQAMGWVLDHSTAEGAERLVLLALANHAGPSPVDGAWESYPGVETIQREANLRRVRTVQEVLARLVAGGHIERIVNGAPDERIRSNRRPNLYHILVARGKGFAADPANTRTDDKDLDTRGAARRQGTNGKDPAIRDDAERHPSENLGVPFDDNQGCRLTTSRGAVSQHPGVPPDGTQTVSEPSVEPSGEPKTVIAVPATARHLAAVAAVSEPLPLEPAVAAPQTMWDLFWERWPRKTHKAEALKAWRVLVGAGVRDVDVLAGLDRWLAYWHAAGTDPEFIRYPAKWLKTREWAEAPPPLTRATRSGARGQSRGDELHGVLANFLAKEEPA